MARKVLIQVRRGLEKDIGILSVGELGFCTDTEKLYIGTTSGNVLLVAAQTVGDMLKSIYDTNNDGIVDRASVADAVGWTNVSGKPTEFPPSSHPHTIANITSLQTTLDSKMNGVSSGSNADPNTTTLSYILTNHLNSPGGNIYWHITTFFYSSRTGNRAQIAVSYNGSTPRFLFRHIYGTVWTNWDEPGLKAPVTWGQLKGGA